MLSRLVLAITVAVIALAGAPAHAKAPSKRECRQACEAGINVCMNSCGDFGTSENFRRTCKKAVIKRCKREGTGFCQQLLPPTTTTTIAGGTTTTTLQRFVDNGDGTITDGETGLMWEKKSNDGSIHDVDDRYTWSSPRSEARDGTIFTQFLPALNAGAGFAGHTDWRLPEVNKDGGESELDSLVHVSQAGEPQIFPEFNSSCTPGCEVSTCSCTALYFYWSSTVYARRPEDAWVVDFGAANATADGKDNALYVRAVRGGQ